MGYPAYQYQNIISYHLIYVFMFFRMLLMQKNNRNIGISLQYRIRECISGLLVNVNMINHGANYSARSVIEIGKRVDMDTSAGCPTINCCLASLSAGHFYFEDLFK